ncbi:uncharacterized protein LOC129809850 isoform X2 [Phlebotomus papatasi]|uniref:uncharacterized protein LOC129809850 isoform X2 n=1 Tax=Phlebotomus papatasi TaxID=29031 RepID=UPI002483A281|nr:uncharacterized protein LOC129809850 isoform X2 [Phlebotomus papatasi]
MPHLTTLWKAIVLSFIINYFLVSADVESTTVSDSLAMETSYEDDDLIPSFILPKHIFNEGKPFYVDKDPISGKLDFSSKKSAGLENFISNVADGNKEKATDIHPPGPNEITPNFHDFLNLPVKYSSAKSVYPLVSSSYANLKYQGNNKNYVSNHKNYTTSTTSSPKYYTSSQKQTTTTKLFSSTKPFTSTIRSTERPTTSTTITTTPSTTPSTSSSTTTTSTPRTETTSTTTSTTAFRRRPSQSTSSTTLTTPPSRRTYPTTATPTYATRPTRPTRGPIKYEYTPKPTFEETQKKSTEFKKSTVELHRSTSPVPPSTTTTTPVKSSTSSPSPSTPVSIPIRFPANSEASLNTEKKPMTLSDLFNSFSEDEEDEIDEEIATDSNAIQQENSSERVKDHQITQIKNSGGAQFQHDDYVKYEVQRPNLNVMPYQPVSSMNNIVISPDQNSASFVLGSQQAVGESHGGGVFVGSAEQAPIFEGNSQRPHGFTTMPSIQIKPHEYKSTSVRFPSATDQQMEAFENAPVITGTYNNEITIPNGHSAPVALPHHQIVVFPPNEKLPVATVNAELGSNFDSKQVGTRIVFGSDEPIQQPSENDFQQQKAPSLPENLTPPLEGAPVQHQHQQRPNTLQNNQYMGFNRPHPPPHFLYGHDSHRKAIPPAHRPILDRPLPNILPQFRPNAKVSHGHPYNKEVGVQRVSPLNGPRRPQDIGIHHPVPPPPPSFPIRRTPLPNHFTSKIAPGVRPIDFNHSEPNRRIYRLPPPRMPQGSIPGPDRLYAQSLPPRKFIDGFPVAPDAMPPPAPPRGAMPPPPPPPYENDNFYKLPPRSKLMERNDQEKPKLEPVVTLQMMQTKKLLQGSGNSQAQNVTAAINVGQPQHGVKLGGSEKSPVYVVYPIKSGSDTEDPIVIGQRGDQLPLPPSEIGSISHTGGEYQNTPFTIIHHEQEPILSAKHKLHAIPKPPKTHFPYFMEQPDPKSVEMGKVSTTLKKVEEQPHSVYNIGEEPLGPPVEQKISSTLTRVTDRPIAIAYTPTEPNHYRRPVDQFPMPNYGHHHPIVSEIRDTQTEASFTRDESEFPVRDEHYEQDFQAPFFPSINLGTVTDPYRGPPPSFPDTTNNKIDRADVDINETEFNSAELVTKRFDADAFQPEYLSGFKPIYPSDPHHSQNIQQSSTEIRETSASTTEESPRTEEPPIKSEMSSFEQTLDALFGSMDDDEEDGESFDEDNMDVDTTTTDKR